MKLRFSRVMTLVKTFRLRRIAGPQPVCELTGTNLVLSLEKPAASLPSETLAFRIRWAGR